MNGPDFGESGVNSSAEILGIPIPTQSIETFLSAVQTSIMTVAINRQMNVAELNLEDCHNHPVLSYYNGLKCSDFEIPVSSLGQRLGVLVGQADREHIWH